MNLPVSLCMEATLSCEVNDCIDSVQHNKNVERTVLHYCIPLQNYLFWLSY